MQEVVDLTDPDAAVNLDDDGILALQIALDLSTKDMDEMKELIVPMLDPNGTRTLTREAWRAVSATWHASGKSFPAFVTTMKESPLLLAKAEVDMQQSTQTTMGTGMAPATGTYGAAAGEEGQKMTAAAEVDAFSPPPFSSS